MTREPLFCVERQDVNGDKRPDEAGYSVETGCDRPEEAFRSEDTYHNHVYACSQDRYLPFNLTGDARDGSVTVWVDPPQKPAARKVDLHPGDHVLGAQNAILTYDPSSLLVRKEKGLVGLTEKVWSLLNAVKNRMSWGERAVLAGHLASYIASPSVDRIVAGIQYVNTKLPASERLNAAQVRVLADLAWKYRDQLVRKITQGERWVYSRTDDDFGHSVRFAIPMGRYVDVLLRRPVQKREERLFPLNLLINDDFSWFDLTGLRQGLGIDLNTHDLVLVDRYFVAAKLVAGNPNPSLDDYEPHLDETVGVLRPSPNPGLQGTRVWVDHDDLAEACEAEIGVDIPKHYRDDWLPGTVIGQYEFTQGALPRDSSDLTRFQAYKVLLDNGTPMLLSSTRVFTPVGEVPGDHVAPSVIFCGLIADGCEFVQVGTKLEMTPDPPAGDKKRRKIAVTLTGVFHDLEDDARVAIGRDAEGNHYRLIDYIGGEQDPVFERIQAKEVPESPQPIRIGDTMEIAFLSGSRESKDERRIETEVTVTNIAWSPYDIGGYWSPLDHGNYYLLFAEDACGAQYVGSRYLYEDIRHRSSSFGYSPSFSWDLLNFSEFTCQFPAAE